MNADDISTTKKSILARISQKLCILIRSLQQGNFGIGSMSGGEVKGNAKVAGQSEENNTNQSQKVANNVNINLNQQDQNKLNLLKVFNKKNIKASVKQGDIKYSAEASTVEEIAECMISLKEIFNVEIENIEKGSIKFILKGSEENLNSIAKLFKTGALTPVLRQQFNLELENAKSIDSDSYTNGKNNQKLLVFTIAGNVSQADIDILKAALIDTSDDDEEIKNNENSSSNIVNKTNNHKDVLGSSILAKVLFIFGVISILLLPGNIYFDVVLKSASLISILLVLIAYLLGSIPTGYIVGRYLKGIDIREHGSGSAGATNVLRCVGKSAAIAVLLIDLFKGLLALALINLVYALAPNDFLPADWHPWLITAAGLSAVIGHSKSIWLNFTGGKSVATTWGVLLVMNPVVALGTFASFGIILSISRIVSLSSICGAIAVSILMVALNQPLPYLIFAALAGLYVILRHKTNIPLLLAGREPKWKWGEI